jgi:hypothetical protein
MCHRKTSGRSVEASEGEAANFHAYDRFGSWAAVPTMLAARPVYPR